MTTTQELIEARRLAAWIGVYYDPHDAPKKEILAVSTLLRKQADALEALQAEMAQAKFSYMDGYEGGKQEARDASHEEIKGLTAERDSALARERHTRETLHKFMSAAGASPQLPTMDDALATGDGTLHALIDKLQARVAELEAQPVQASQAQVVEPVEEQQVFEDWLARVCPSGDVDSVQAQWLASWDYREWCEDQAEATPQTAAQPSQARELSEAVQNLIDATEGLMAWQVKNVKVWHNGAYDTADLRVKQIRAAINARETK